MTINSRGAQNTTKAAIISAKRNQYPALLSRQAKNTVNNTKTHITKAKGYVPPPQNCKLSISAAGYIHDRTSNPLRKKSIIHGQYIAIIHIKLPCAM